MTDGINGKRILVVEDEFYVASDLSRSLQGLGATVIGPAPDVATGLRLAEETLDAAVLDRPDERAGPDRRSPARTP